MMQDPISDTLARIRNAQAAAKREVSMPSSKLKLSLVSVLKEEGYIADFREENKFSKRLIVILKYYKGKPVISMLRRVSKPSLRVYSGKNELPKVHGGLGVAVISTSKGMMSDSQARHLGEGGEVICYVS
ncbi:30S ribosomal protein S8 [Coxiella endosymbiont of Amblyomma sculptum]|uniref:30S ribosomal protein S8 n=1 Tax=Coxiella endosymbiont of Amblyomma sculptum TaxID=2487929 RepID=UPI001C5549CA